MMISAIAYCETAIFITKT